MLQIDGSAAQYNPAATDGSAGYIKTCRELANLEPGVTHGQSELFKLSDETID
jgi:hypothetical protein